MHTLFLQYYTQSKRFTFKVDVAVIEVIIGGAVDATNILRSAETQGLHLSVSLLAILLFNTQKVIGVCRHFNRL